MSKQAKSAGPRATGKQETQSSGYVRAEFAIGAAIVCFVLGFFAARILGNTSGAGNEGFTVQQNTPLPVQSDDTQWLEDLEEQAKSDPENADVWTRLGNAYYDTDRYEPAIEAYTKSLQLAPGNPNVITDMGVMYRRLDNPQEAIRQFDRAVAADPNHEMSIYNKGIVLLHDIRDTEGALEAWKSLAKRNPQFRTPTGQLLSDLVRSLE